MQTLLVLHALHAYRHTIHPYNPPSKNLVDMYGYHNCIKIAITIATQIVFTN